LHRHPGESSKTNTLCLSIVKNDTSNPHGILKLESIQLLNLLKPKTPQRDRETPENVYVTNLWILQQHHHPLLNQKEYVEEIFSPS
jgi:hypothetical protein